MMIELFYTLAFAAIICASADTHAANTQTQLDKNHQEILERLETRHAEILEQLEYINAHIATKSDINAFAENVKNALPEQEEE